MTISRPFAFVFTATFLLASQAALGQVYRWVDDEGRTIVSDSPPPGKSKAQKLTKGNGTPATPAVTPAPASPAKEKAVQDQPPKVTTQAATPDMASCRLAQQNLQTLESGVPMVTKGADGQQLRMDDAAKAREVARAKDFLQNCRF
jgi:hypothetical protein